MMFKMYLLFLPLSSLSLETCKSHANIEKCKNLHREWFKAFAQNIGTSNGKDVVHGWDEVRKVIVHWVSIGK